MDTFSKIKNIAIAGSGTMGTGIAQVFATAAIQVIIFDLSDSALKTAEVFIASSLDKAIQKGKITPAQKEYLLSLITFTTDEKKVKGELILEAIIENLEAKQTFFQKAERNNPPETIFASNTSTIPVALISEGLKYPERVVGMHFFNPPTLMKLVEVISGDRTSPEISARVCSLAEQCGKVFVKVKDRPGFIVNRVARHYYLEGLRLLEESACEVPGIDRLLEGAGFKMGPFRLMDLIGNDVNFAVSSSLFASFNEEPRFKPSDIQKKMVTGGLLGVKSGKGFYEY